MAPPVRFVHSSTGYSDLMSSPAMTSVISARAAKVRAAVRARYPEADWDVIADVQQSGDRVVGIVSGVSLRDEAAERILGSALDAAR